MSLMRMERWSLNNNNIIMITYDTAEPITTIWQLQYYQDWQILHRDIFVGTVRYNNATYNNWKSFHRAEYGSIELAEEVGSSNAATQNYSYQSQSWLWQSMYNRTPKTTRTTTTTTDARNGCVPAVTFPQRCPTSDSCHDHIQQWTIYCDKVSQDSSDEWNDRCATSFRPNEPAIFMFETSTCHHHGNRITIVVRVTYSISHLNNDDVSFGR